jgi:hypothetical protein
LFLLIGCSKTYLSVQPKIIPVKKLEKIPLSVALYMDRPLSVWVYDPCIDIGSAPGSCLFEISMGAALSDGAEFVAREAFKDVIIIDSTEAKIISEELEALVIVEVDKIYSNETIKMTFSHYGTVTVRLKWTIQDPKGKKIYFNTFVGEAKYRRAPTITMGERMKEAFSKASEEQFRKAFEGITSARWWKLVNKNTMPSEQTQ